MGRVPPRLFFTEKILDGEVREALERLGVTEIQALGAASNLRRWVELPGVLAGSRIALDRTVMPGGHVDYEVEVEDNDTGRRACAVAAVRAIAPGAVPSPLSKYQRFAAAVG